MNELSKISTHSAYFFQVKVHYKNTNIGFTKTDYHLYHTIIGKYPVLQFRYHKTVNSQKSQHEVPGNTRNTITVLVGNNITQFMNSIDQKKREK